MKKRIICIVYYLFVVVTLSLGGCKGKEPAQEVVIYTSLDKVFSQPILEAFEKETGIKVLDVYDSEATKTTGLVNRLIAEKDSPRADVFWNSETGRTIVLKQKGVLTKYISPSASDIPAQFKDPDGCWTGFAARYLNFAPMDHNRWKGGTPAWADAGTVVPWRMYQNYGDTRMLAEHYESARRWVDYIHSKNPNLLWEREMGDKFNDWLNGDTLVSEGWPRTGGAVPPRVLATAFFAHSTENVAKMAAVIGRTDDAKKYGRLFEGIKAAFNEKYVQPDGRIEGDTQAGYALALRFNLLPDSLRPKAAKHMVNQFERYNGHMSTGIQTSHRLMLELTRNGYNNEAYRLLNLRTFPSWGFMIEQGATTIWERWDGYVKGRGFQEPMMNSFNHWALGSVGEWIWRCLIGINPDESSPGYKHFTIKPMPGGDITWARGEYKSIRGTIISDWRLENGNFRLDVTVPANTTATVYLPAKDAKSVTIDGEVAAESRLVQFLGIKDGKAAYAVNSGRYQFVSVMSRLKRSYQERF